LGKKEEKIQSQIKNPCIRCGKLRVVDRTWKEYMNRLLVTCTNTVCPDPACQKIVDEEIAARVEKRELLVKNRSFSASKKTKPSQ